MTYTLGEPLDEDALVMALDEQWHQACDYFTSEIADQQEVALKFYNGDPFGDEVDGLSQIVLTDVRDAVDHMAIQVIKPFVSGERVVEIEAKNEDDEQYADEATEAVSKAFMRGQDGFRVIHDWCKAGLKEDYCALKSTVMMERKVVTQRMMADADQAMMAQEGGAEVEDNGDGSYTVTVKQEVTTPKFYDYTIPSEEYRFTRRARSEDDADYQAHACRKTRSDLVMMGFDAEQVYELPTGDDELIWDGRATARDKYDGRDDNNSNPSMQEVLLLEEYIRIDADGDGVAELLKVFRVAKTILSVEVVNEQPFTVFTPYPEPHRLVGTGLATRSMLYQRVRSVVARQLMNGMYRHNEPRFWVPQESMTTETLDDLLETVGPVRGKGNAPTVMGGNFDVSKSLTVMEFFSRERQMATGITDINQGLQPDVLNTTATAAQIQDDRGAETAEFIARVFGEAFARAFIKKYRLLKELGEPFDIKVDGQYRRVDPSQWPDDVDVLVRVGLGTGRKDTRLGILNNLLQIQREGYLEGLVGEEHIFKTISGIVKDAGLGQPDDYWKKPDPNAEPQPEKPDPEMAKVQAEAQMAQARLQGEQQLAEARMRLMQQEAQMKSQLAQAEAEEKARLARERAEFEATMAIEQADREYQLAVMQAERNADIAERKAAALPTNRPGGDLDK
jgi:hypothetical protein